MVPVTGRSNLCLRVCLGCALQPGISYLLMQVLPPHLAAQPCVPPCDTGCPLHLPPWGGQGTQLCPPGQVSLAQNGSFLAPLTSPSSPLPKTFLLWGSPQRCPPSQLFLAVRGYIYPLCSCSSSVTIFCYRIFWLLVEALIRNAAINGYAPLPLGCSFFNPHCLLQCHPFPFFFIEFQVYCTC